MESNPQIVSKLGIRREPGFLYFLRGTDVYRAPLKKGGGTNDQKGVSEKVMAGNFAREPGFLYFIDKSGHIAKVARKVGGAKS